LLAAAVLVFDTAGASAQVRDAAARGDKAQLSVMTRNLYLGGDLALALTATNPQEFIDAATTIFANVEATNFNQRAQALADEIAAAEPDLVGLQEVALWRSNYPSSGPSAPTATKVEFDFLAILLDALAERRVPYEAVAVVEETDVQVPAGANGFRCDIPLGFVLGRCRDIRFTDRDVILMKSGHGAGHIRVTRAQTGTFLANVAQDIPGFGTFTANRGWTAVDAQVSGQAFRFVSAHLDPDISFVQTAQALEILAGPAATPLPVIFVCDCNSPADGSGTPTYASLVAAGMRDAWIAVRGTPGYTCCQNADLLNPQSLLDERLDIIWLHGDISPVKARLVGDADRDRTDSGLWPSDHAGVFAKLRLGGGTR
jgi:endonuclease/exonuclease/phosphatase family metal-dependent hydrolase